MYIGQTTRTAYERLCGEINTAYSLDSHTPISNFIRKVGRYNVSIFVLQTVEATYLDYYERKWIHRLQTHVKIGKRKPMNINPEQQPLKKKKRVKNKGHEKMKQANPPIMREVSTLLYLSKYKKVTEMPPSTINTINISNLYKILSICENKPIYHRPKPISKEDIDRINASHEYIKAFIHTHVIHNIKYYVMEAIVTKITQLKTEGHKTKRKFPFIDICTVIYPGKIANKIRLEKIINKNIHKLPGPMSYISKPKIVYKNPPSISKKLYNHKKAAEELIDKNHRLITCNCTKIPENYTSGAHVLTGNLDVLYLLMPEESEYNIHKLTTLMKLGTKFVEIPSMNKLELIKMYQNAIAKFVEKIKKYHKKHTKKESTQYIEWKNLIVQKIEKVLNTIKIPIKCEILKQIAISKLIKKIHKNYVITCVDKMPGNFSIICKKYWLQALYDNTISPKQKGYIIWNKKEEDIIKRHKKYLNNNKFKIYAK